MSDKPPVGPFLPKNSVKEVALAVEFDPGFMTANDWFWAASQSFLTDGDAILIQIQSDTAAFLKSLGVMAEKYGCSQDLISHLKWAKEQGARWVVVTSER